MSKSNEELTPEVLSECKKRLQDVDVPEDVLVWPNRHYILVAQAIEYGKDYDWYRTRCHEERMLPLGKYVYLIIRRAVLAEVP